MDISIFDRLLYEEESATLDFKREQYRFVKATDEEKSELLKDILGFVNAWRRSDAYILIGVEDVRGGQSKVIGIPNGDHLDDHSLQQFVNSLTNRPVLFHYEAFGYANMQVGVIRIEQQQRPVYLKRDFGKLKRDAVYVRRGSSTDPQTPASPEEIAQMGNSAGAQSAELSVEFGDVERDDSLGHKISWEAERCDMPPMESIPDYNPNSRSIAPGLEISFADPRSSTNEDYLRELANYEFVARLFRPVRLVVKNVGTVSTANVRIEIAVPTNVGLAIMASSDIPERPERKIDLFNIGSVRHATSSARQSPGTLEIDKNDERFRIEIECGELQPGRRVWSEVFYIGMGDSGDVALTGQILAEKLPKPQDFELIISAKVARSQMSVAELRALTWAATK